MNEAPEFTNVPNNNRFRVFENRVAVRRLPAVDPDADEEDAIVTYALSGTDAGLFDIGRDGAITFKDAPDFENPDDGDADNRYLVTVAATAGAGTREMTRTLALEVRVRDANEPPGFDVTALTTNDAGTVLFSVAENTTAVGTVTADPDPDADDAGATVTYGLSGTDASLFSISDAGVVAFRAAPNFEDPKGGESDDSNTYALTVEATAGAGDRATTGGVTWR